MLFSTRVATIFIAVAFIGWAIMHFMIGDFIAGRAPAWPQDVPGKIIWAYASGLVLTVAGVLIIGDPTRTIKSDATIVRVGVTCTGLMILGWAGARNLFVVLSTLDYGGVLTNLGKSITIGSGALLVAYAVSKEPPKYIYTLACVCTGIFFTASGIQHFLFIDFVKTLVPRWIPGDVFWSYVAGVGLIAAGVALITGILRKQAALVASWMVFAWFVILHVPRGFGETASYNEWIAIFEALAVASLLAVIYWREKSAS